MIELQTWAKNLSMLFIILAFHFSGWALAAPIGWKFWTGVIGLGASILALVITAAVGRK